MVPPTPWLAPLELYPTADAVAVGRLGLVEGCAGLCKSSFLLKAEASAFCAGRIKAGLWEPGFGGAPLSWNGSRSSVFSVCSLCPVDGIPPRCPLPLPLKQALTFSFWLLLLLLCVAVAPSLLLVTAGCRELLLVVSSLP